jgi:hypothetical protein
MEHTWNSEGAVAALAPGALWRGPGMGVAGAEIRLYYLLMVLLAFGPQECHKAQV